MGLRLLDEEYGYEQRVTEVVAFMKETLNDPCSVMLKS